MDAPVIGHYGKLPISPEFLRRHAAGPELRALDEWMQHGILYAQAKEGARWPTLVDESELWNFMHVPPGRGRIVCGNLFASRDKAGRSFPFLYFLLLDGEDLSQRPWLVPMVAAQFLEGAADDLRLLRSGLDWNRFCRTTEVLRGPIGTVESAANAFDCYVQNSTVGEWWAGLWGSGDDVKPSGLVRNFSEFIREAKQQSRFENLSRSGIKCPLQAGAESDRFDLPFWLAASLQSLAPDRRRQSEVLCFWNRNSQSIKPCALISVGSGSPQLVRFLVSPGAHEEVWHDLVLPGGQFPEGLGQSVSSAAGDPTGPLARLLEHFSTVDRAGF